MTDDGIREFQIMVFTYDLIAGYASCPEEADELILLAASYGPPKNITTD
jgi:hypothetical protein